ncbi:MAG: RNA polymerase subunit sigma-24, partial [Nitrospirales bacterium]
GRLELLDGNLEKAKDYLIESGKTPGSPQLNSFGPNMSLARDLIKKGEEQVVFEYFNLCRQFWELDFGKLSRWTFYIKLGITPGFGANLVY